MTLAPAGRRAIFSSPRRSSLMNTATDKQRKALGKGLSALLPARTLPALSANAAPVVQPVSSLPIDSIKPNPMQPRSVFNPDRLEELAASIRSNGIIQPLVVRQADGDYQIVAGERRWR